MATKKNEVATKDTFSGQLSTALAEVKDALPKDLNVARFVNNAVAVMNENTQLQDFAKANGTSQIKAGLVKGAYLGLDFMNKEAYLVPYGKQLNFMKSYTGAVKLCKKYSIRPLKDIYAKLVRDGDDYQIEIINNEPKVTFKPKPFNNGKIKGAFAVACFEDGGIQYEEMSLAELEKVRSCSKMKSGVVWNQWTDQMYLKSVLHRLCKRIEIDFDNAEQMQYFNEEMQIETDPKAQAKADVEQNANQQNLDDEVVVEVSPEEIEGQMSMEFGE
jgi:recombination protein RecT